MASMKQHVLFGCVRSLTGRCGGTYGVGSLSNMAREGYCSIRRTSAPRAGGTINHSRAAATSSGIHRCSNVVTAQWVHQQLMQPPHDDRSRELCILDATWFMPGQSDLAGEQYHHEVRIPTSCHFDIDAVSSPSPWPHMLPSKAQLLQVLSHACIQEEGVVVVYDAVGIFSAPRLWWTLRVMGMPADRVKVLNGGLPAWRRQGYPVATGTTSRAEDDELLQRQPRSLQKIGHLGDKAARLPVLDAPVEHGVAVYDEMLGYAKAGYASADAPIIVDARAARRFSGLDPEPRAGVRPGHIPGSINVPFTALLEKHGGVFGGTSLLPPNQIANVFDEHGCDVLTRMRAGQRRVITTCGSGVTACVLTLALQEIGVPSTVYDGSWSEYGARDGSVIDAHH